MEPQTLGPHQEPTVGDAHEKQRDTLLSLRGSAKHLFSKQSGDAFLSEEREGWDRPEEQSWAGPASPEVVWKRIQELEGETFYTVRGLPFTYEVVDGGWWPYRNGKRINRMATYAHFLRGLERCPLHKTTEISDLFNPSYWFGVLTDKRIRRSDW